MDIERWTKVGVAKNFIPVEGLKPWACAASRDFAAVAKNFIPVEGLKPVTLAYVITVVIRRKKLYPG